MAVPKFEKFLEAFLKAVSDGTLHSTKEVKDIVAREMNLSQNDRAETVPSGRQSSGPLIRQWENRKYRSLSELFRDNRRRRDFSLLLRNFPAEH